MQGDINAILCQLEHRISSSELKTVKGMFDPALGV
jgi:hypothetical protein